MFHSERVDSILMSDLKLTTPPQELERRASRVIYRRRGQEREVPPCRKLRPIGGLQQPQQLQLRESPDEGETEREREGGGPAE